MSPLRFRDISIPKTPRTNKTSHVNHSICFLEVWLDFLHATTISIPQWTGKSNGNVKVHMFNRVPEEVLLLQVIIFWDWRETFKCLTVEAYLRFDHLTFWCLRNWFQKKWEKGAPKLHISPLWLVMRSAWYVVRTLSNKIMVLEFLKCPS